MNDVASISQMAQANTAAQIGMKVAVKANNVAKQQGAAVVSLLESAAEFSRAVALDTGKGNLLDVVG